MRIVILGAGPVGLEAALAGAARGHDVTVYEAAERVGGNVRSWAHVRTFTPWDLVVSPRVRAILGDAAPSGEALPTGAEIVAQVLDPVAASPALAGRIRTGVRVVAVAREGLLKHEEIGSEARGARPFRLLLAHADGSESLAHADAVIDATGTYGHPNRLGDGGIDALGERAFDERITRRLTPVDPAWAGRTLLLTGAGASAQTAARDLAAFARDAPGTKVVWAVRAPDPDWGAVPGDALPARAALNAGSKELQHGASDAVRVLPGVVTEALRPADGRVAVTLRNGDAQEVVVDHVLALNGGVGDASLYRQLQVHECYATLGPIKLAATLLASSGADCLAVGPAGPDVLLNPEPHFFILGAKSYGRNSQFLLRTGWQQVDDVFTTHL